MRDHSFLRCRPLLCALFTAPLALTGCGVFDFDYNQAVPEQKVQGSVLGQIFGTLVPNPFPLTINLAQETQAHGTGPVKAAGLKSLTFQTTNGTDFNFVQSCDITVESNMPGTTLTKQKIADLSAPPGHVPTLNFHTYPDVNLLPYINEGTKISSTATGSSPPADVTFNGQLVVHVNTF
jgi:hypothetical protein